MNERIQKMQENTVPAVGQNLTDFIPCDEGGAGTRVLFIGNSITRHRPKPEIGWHRNCGMAASCLEKDYVHQVMARVLEVDPRATFAIQSYGSKLLEAAQLNEQVKAAMDNLDELPEIWNILKGDMSLIGPRPLSVGYLPYYTEEERVRHSVRPGLTGLAQASGRNDISWEEKFAYDVEYANNVTFAMDCKVIFKTVKTVLCREGIGQGAQTPESFHIYRQKQWDAQKGE